MNRTQKLKMNTSMSLLNRLVMIISGLILPRLILINYGSETNGLVSSVSQLLGIIAFLDLGVGSVVKSALYRPLAKKDHKEISSVLIAAKDYFKKIAYVLVIYVVFLITFYPLLIDSNYGYLATGFLIFSLSISRFGQYYFGIVNELLLGANQQDYIQLASEIIVIILNLIVSVFLINQGATIEIVKLGSGLVYLIRPIFLSYYVKKNFNINFDIEVEDDPLPQRWSGMGQHIANTIHQNTDVIVLTMFSTLENISVYSIYNIVISAVRMLFTSLTSGIIPFFGNLLANEERELLEDYFSKIEWLLHTGAVFLFGMTAVLINDFVLIYTSGIYDVSYEAPLFSLLFVLAYLMYSIRSPYRMMIFAAGHFKGTQIGSFIEAALNIVISLLLVNSFGLAGIALATFIAMSFQTLYLVNYLSENILYRPKRIFIKHILIDLFTFFLMMLIGFTMNDVMIINTIVEWVIFAIITGIFFILITLVINLFFYKEPLTYYLRRLARKK